MEQLDSIDMCDIDALVLQYDAITNWRQNDKLDQFGEPKVFGSHEISWDTLQNDACYESFGSPFGDFADFAAATNQLSPLEQYASLDDFEPLIDNIFATNQWDSFLDPSAVQSFDTFMPGFLLNDVSEPEFTEEDKEFWDEFFETPENNSQTEVSSVLPDPVVKSEMPIVSVDTLDEEKPHESTSDESCPEKECKDRSPKALPGRYKSDGLVDVLPSYVQCMGMVIDYKGQTGIIHRVILNDAITNIKQNPHNVAEQKQLMAYPLNEYYTVKPGEEVVGLLHGEEDASSRRISVILGLLQRKVYLRDISKLSKSVTLVTYVESTRFNINMPYELQYFRFEVDSKGRIINESKCGLCAFCPEIKFLPYKNSSYLSHLTLEHGVCASNFIVPEGLFYGMYRMIKANNQQSSRLVKGLQCPVCFQVIEVGCWKKKLNPLLSYFRHFKKHHLKLTKTFVTSTVDPVNQKYL